MHPADIASIEARLGAIQSALNDVRAVLNREKRGMSVEELESRLIQFSQELTDPSRQANCSEAGPPWRRSRRQRFWHLPDRLHGQPLWFKVLYLALTPLRLVLWPWRRMTADRRATDLLERLRAAGSR